MTHLKLALFSVLIGASLVLGSRENDHKQSLSQFHQHYTMSCMWLQVNPSEVAADAQNFKLWSYYDSDLDNDFGLRLDLESSRLSFVSLDGHGSDVEVKQLTDGKEHYLCFAWREEKKMWKLYIDGKKVKSGTLHEDVEVENHGKEHVNENQLEKYNLVFYRNIDDTTKDLSTLADPDVLSKDDLPVFKMLDVSFEEKDTENKKEDSSSSESSESKESDEKASGDKSKGKVTKDDAVTVTVDLLGRYMKNKNIHVNKIQREDADSAESLESGEIKSRHTRSEKSSPSKDDDDVMLSDQPKKEVVEETLTKKTASKDQFALSDILDQGNLNKIKDFGSKFDPSFNSKIDSFFNRNGGSSPSSSSNSGSTGGLGGLGSLGGLGNLGSFGGFGGGGGSGGMPNLGSLASAFGGGNGGSGGLNINQFLSGSNGLSNLFKSGDKTPKTPSNPSYPSYPSSNPTNPPPYNPNYPPGPQSSGSLYPTLPKDPQPAVPLSTPTNSHSNNNNKGSVSLSDILGGFGGGVGGTRLGDKAEPNKGPGYDISFGEIFGFGGNKNKNNNPNYPENNHKPSSGGVSLKDILGFGGSNKDESKNSYVPSYGTIGGGLEPSKTRPKSNFDEISEGLGLSVDPDPIVRNNKPIVVLNQPNQKSSLTESARGSMNLNSQRTNTNTYASRKPANEKSLADIQRAVEEDIIQPTKARRTRRNVNPRGSAKYQQRDGDEISFNFQNKYAKDIAE